MTVPPKCHLRVAGSLAPTEEDHLRRLSKAFRLSFARHGDTGHVIWGGIGGPSGQHSSASVYKRGPMAESGDYANSVV